MASADEDSAALAARVMAEASRMAKEDRQREVERFGGLAPCRNLSPLEPPLRNYEQVSCMACVST